MEILQNLVQMTGQRDHMRLEVSVLSTFMRLPHIVGVRLLELVEIDGTLWMRPRTWTQGGQLLSAEVDFFDDPARSPLASVPELERCIQQSMEQHLHDHADGTHLLWLPVWMHNKPTMCIEITQSRPFSEHALDVLLPIFYVYRNYQSLLDYSERDALTGLLNRKTFDADLLRFVAVANSRPDASLRPWLATVDIDHFKSVNDTYGHLFGDEVLILVSNLMRSTFSVQDRIFRFGGEEFVVLLHPMSLQDATQSLEHFREQVQNYDFPQVGRVTVSIGFAEAGMTTPTELIGRADQALYWVKKNGRNQVAHYETLQSKGELSSVKQEIAWGDVDLF